MEYYYSLLRCTNHVCGSQVRRLMGRWMASLDPPYHGRHTTRRPYCTVPPGKRLHSCPIRFRTETVAATASATCWPSGTSRRSGAIRQRPVREPVPRARPARRACLTCSPTRARPITWPKSTWASVLSCTRHSSTTGGCWCRRLTGRSIRLPTLPDSTTRGQVGRTDK